MQPLTNPFSRRRFLAGGAAALSLSPFQILRAREGSANDEILIGIIGCGGMGNNNMTNFLSIEGVRVVAVCDVDRKAMDSTQKKVNEKYGNKDCKAYADYRELLQHPGLDAVSLATPDHWHARIAVDSANAGMDIYGEKPLTWGLAEGRLLVDAVAKNQCVWQTGCWQRSKGEFRRFKALVLNDTIGKITRVECGTPKGMDVRGEKGKKAKKPVAKEIPQGFDWKAWCGPVKDFAYHPGIHPFNWRWRNETGGGQLLDWVGHHVDIALWTLGLDDTGPVKVVGKGKAGDHDYYDTYVEYSYEGTFGDGRLVEVRSDFGGTKFTGDKGWLHVNRGKLEASDREFLRNLPEDFDTKPPSHWQNFVDCVRSRKLTEAPAGPAHRAASFGQLAIVAMDTKEPVNWDPETEKVIGNSEQASHPRLGARMDA